MGMSESELMEVKWIGWAVTIFLMTMMTLIKISTTDVF